MDLNIQKNREQFIKMLEIVIDSLKNSSEIGEGSSIKVENEISESIREALGNSFAQPTGWRNALIKIRWK